MTRLIFSPILQRTDTGHRFSAAYRIASTVTPLKRGSRGADCERGRLTEGGPIGEDDADVEGEEEGDAEDEGDREDSHHHQLDLVRRRLPQLPLGKGGRTYHSSRWRKAAQNSQIRHKYQKVPQLSWGRKAAKLKYNASTTAAVGGRSLKVVQCIQRMYHSCHLRKVEEGLTVNTMHVPQLSLEEGLTVNTIQVPQLSLEEGL